MAFLRTIRPLNAALCAALAALWLAGGGLCGEARAQAQPVKGEVAVTSDNGFVRVLLTFAEEVESQVRVVGGIVVINFKKPVDVVVDRINAIAPGYISAARRDPDGKAIRIALARKVTVNPMAAGERLFVDLLPDTWTALPPGLPKEVIEELARRAREAEKLLKQQRGAGARPQPPVRVRVATQPTFTRYVFELPGATSVNSEREDDNLTLVFGAPLKFDLADVKTSLPAMVSAIDSDRAMTSAKVRFMLAGNPEIRAFRDDSTYVVDIGTEEAGKRKADPVAAALENAR
ncbi:MAG: tetratricopeptide repeat protein, partial [Pseudorhodoplanes sp.]